MFQNRKKDGHQVSKSIHTLAAIFFLIPENLEGKKKHKRVMSIYTWTMIYEMLRKMRWRYYVQPLQMGQTDHFFRYNSIQTHPSQYTATQNELMWKLINNLDHTLSCTYVKSKFPANVTYTSVMWQILVSLLQLQVMPILLLSLHKKSPL